MSGHLQFGDNLNKLTTCEPLNRQEYIDRAASILEHAAYCERTGKPNDVMLKEAERFIAEARKR